MKRILIAAALTSVVLWLPSPAQASYPGCRYSVMDPVTGDGLLHAGPVYGQQALATWTHIKCYTRLDGPLGPVLEAKWYFTTPGPVGVGPSTGVVWSGERGDIWLCTAVFTAPYNPRPIELGCSYAFTH